MRLLILLSFIFIVSCSNNKLLTKKDQFKLDACIVVYCESTENNVVKKAGLKVIEMYGDIDIGRGFCNEYYYNRNLLNGWIWARRSAKEICYE